MLESPPAVRGERTCGASHLIVVHGNGDATAKGFLPSLESRGMESVVLVQIGDPPLPQPSAAARLNDSRLAAWFVSSPRLSHPKLHPFPRGVFNTDTTDRMLRAGEASGRGLERRERPLLLWCSCMTLYGRYDGRRIPPAARRATKMEALRKNGCPTASIVSAPPVKESRGSNGLRFDCEPRGPHCAEERASEHSTPSSSSLRGARVTTTTGSGRRWPPARLPCIQSRRRPCFPPTTPPVSARIGAIPLVDADPGLAPLWEARHTGSGTAHDALSYALTMHRECRSCKWRTGPT